MPEVQLPRPPVWGADCRAAPAPVRARVRAQLFHAVTLHVSTLSLPRPPPRLRVPLHYSLGRTDGLKVGESPAWAPAAFEATDCNPGPRSETGSLAGDEGLACPSAGAAGPSPAAAAGGGAPEGPGTAGSGASEGPLQSEGGLSGGPPLSHWVWAASQLGLDEHQASGTEHWQETKGHDMAHERAERQDSEICNCCQPQPSLCFSLPRCRNSWRCPALPAK
jgi:hypothetical protein